MQAALSQWLLDISKRRAVMIAIDDIHIIDEPSISFLATLSHLVSTHKIILVITAQSDAYTVSDAAMKALGESATTIELANINAENTTKLLGSVFAEVPNTQLLADRIYKVSEGNPRAIMQLTQHLVDKGVVTYRAGTWSLPERFDENDLPGSLTDALTERLNALSIESRELVEAMALSLDKRFSFEECLTLTEHKDTPRLIHNLEELISSEVLTTDNNNYTFSQQAWVKALIDNTDNTRKPKLHLRIAQMFEKRGTEQFRVAQHLLSADEKEKSLDVFIDFSERSKKITNQNPGAYTDLLEALPADWFDSLTEAISLARQQGRPPKQIYTLQRRLSGLASITCKQDPLRQIELFRELAKDSGLDLYNELADSIPPQERLKRALEQAKQRYDTCPESERVLAPMEAIRELAKTIVEASASIYSSNDYSYLQSLPSLEPLAPLAPSLWVIHNLIQATACGVRGHFEQQYQRNRQILDRLDQPDRAGIEETHHLYTRLGVLQSMCIIDAAMGRASDMGYISELEKVSVLQVNAWRIRMLYNLWQANAQEAEQCKKRVELLLVQNSPTYYWQGSLLYPEMLAYGLADDLWGLKHITDEIEKWAKKVSYWVPTLFFARGEYQRIRGDFPNALVNFQKALGQTEPGRYQCWAGLAGAYLKTLFELGRVEETITRGRDMLRSAERENLGYACSYLRIPLALAEASMGDLENAVNDSQAAIETFRLLGSTGLNLGYAYENRARVAIFMNDKESYLEYAGRCAEQYRVGYHPALTAKHEKLLHEARAAGMIKIPQETAGTAYKDDEYEKQAKLSEIRRKITNCRDLPQRAQYVLELLLEHCAAKSGYLFGLKEHGLEFLSTQDGEQAPKELARLANTYIDAELEASIMVTATLADEHAANGEDVKLTLSDGQTFEPLLLYSLNESRTRIVGLAALVPENDSLHFIEDPGFILAIGDALLQAGDVVSKYAVG